MSEIAGKNIVITGGAYGMGRLMAVKMARLGGRVILYDLDATALKAVVDEIGATGQEAYGYVCDVSDRREVYRVADEVKSKVGPVDIVVNYAGIVTGKRLLEIPDERIEAVIGVNVLALYWLTKSFLPEMIERDSGHVVTMASAAGLLGVNRQTDYSASKHAAIGFTESLRGAEEGGPLGRQDHHSRAILRRHRHDERCEVALHAPPTDPQAGGGSRAGRAGCAAR